MCDHEAGIPPPCLVGNFEVNWGNEQPEAKNDSPLARVNEVLGFARQVVPEGGVLNGFGNRIFSEFGIHAEVWDEFLYLVLELLFFASGLPTQQEVGERDEAGPLRGVHHKSGQAVEHDGNDEQRRTND